LFPQNEAEFVQIRQGKRLNLSPLQAVEAHRRASCEVRTASTYKTAMLSP
jgi:hypothetical protein